MKQFDLSLWLKDKSRKVVTRDGREVEIVKYDMKGTHFPILYVISNEDGSQEPCECSKSGMCLFDNTQSSTDLFFADEEDELSEFEKELVNWFLGFNTTEELAIGNAKDAASRLLELARKELEKDAVEFAKSYMEDVNPSFEKVQECEELWKWKMSCLRGINKAYKRGEQDALKDFPKWKKITKREQNYLVYGYLSNDEYYLSIKELIENLPK